MPGTQVLALVVVFDPPVEDPAEGPPLPPDAPPPAPARPPDASPGFPPLPLTVEVEPAPPGGPPPCPDDSGDELCGAQPNIAKDTMASILRELRMTHLPFSLDQARQPNQARH